MIRKTTDIRNISWLITSVMACPLGTVGCGVTAPDTSVAAVAEADDAVDAERVIAQTQGAFSSVETNYNQNDTRWACDQLGTCGGTTLGKCGKSTPAGCAVAATADVLASRGVIVDPGSLNRWLTENGGYANGCLIRWEVAAQYGDSGLSGVDTTGTLTSPAALKALLDEGKAVIVKSSRFGTGHWVAVSGYANAGAAWGDFSYLDPWDASTRHVGDAWVHAGAKTRVFE